MVKSEAQAAGVMVDGDELAPARDATTVRVRDGHTTVTDGPYAEVKEALGGYYRHLHATRADLLRRLARREEAAVAYRQALALTTNTAERRFLERRLCELRNEPQE